MTNIRYGSYRAARAAKNRDFKLDLILNKRVLDYKSFRSDNLIILLPSAMFTIRVAETGSHPDSVITRIKECLRVCFKPGAESYEELRNKIDTSLSQPGLMGDNRSGGILRRKFGRKTRVFVLNFEFQNFKK